MFWGAISGADLSTDNMATGVASHCTYCGDDLTTHSLHGRSVHVGRCRLAHSTHNLRVHPAARVRAPSMSPAPASLAASSSEGGIQDEGASAAGGSPEPPDPMVVGDDYEEEDGIPRNPFQSEADWRLAKLLVRRDTVPSGVLDKILAIFALGGLTFRSTYAVRKAVDALPGPDFETETLYMKPMPDVPYVPAHGSYVPYKCHFRRLRPVVLDSLTRHGALGELVQPILQPAPAETDHVTGAQRYQDLLRTLRDVTGDDTAMLAPLIFHSGACIYVGHMGVSCAFVRAFVRVCAHVCVSSFSRFVRVCAFVCAVILRARLRACARGCMCMRPHLCVQVCLCMCICARICGVQFCV